MIWCKPSNYVIKRFYSTFAVESLKIGLNGNEVTGCVVNRHKYLPATITPNIYKSQLTNLLDKYPYLTQKDSVQLLNLLDNLSDFTLEFGDRQQLALKSFLSHTIHDNHPDSIKILSLRIYNKLVSDDKAFVVRSIIYLFLTFNNVNESINLQLQLLQLLNQVKHRYLNSDSNNLDDEVIYLIKYLFLNGYLNIIDNNNFDINDCVKYTYFLFNLTCKTDDIAHYPLYKLINRFETEIDYINKQSTLELIEMISHSFISNYKYYLLRLCGKLFTLRRELSKKQLQQLKSHLNHAGYVHDFFNPQI